MEKGNNSTIYKSFQAGESPIKDDQVQDQSSRSWLWQQNSGSDADQDPDVQDSQVTEGVGTVGEQVQEQLDDNQDLETSTHQIESLQNLIGKKIEVIFIIIEH